MQPPPWRLPLLLMPSSPSPALPIDELRTPLLEALESGPVVVTAPTGTGKSTQIPRWLPGKTLVIQPRRVAARNVAARIADLQGVVLGKEIGYRVRDEDCSSAQTRLLVVTPGIVLNAPELLDAFDTTVVDEIHERRLDTDLILALLLQKQAPLVAMSATVAGERIAEYLGGRHLSVSARSFPVEVRYADSGDQPPRGEHLARRVRAAIEALGKPPRSGLANDGLANDGLTGDVLVFVPGKGEIQAVVSELSTLRLPPADLEVRALHGGLSLAEQAEVLAPARRADRRRIIVTTNVAETSLTIPGVRVVIDSGLVRQTTYHDGRSYLGLGAIAQDSAEQRAGRAGRTAPGICVRLWSPAIRLDASTAPEIQRESLSPLLLSLAEMKLRPEDLRFLDPPRDFALGDAREELTALGALDEQGRLTSTGHELARLPLDPWLGRVLVAARERNCLPEAIDLVAALEQPRAHLLLSAVPEEDLERLDCDLSALIAAVRAPDQLTGPARAIAFDARESRRRLRRALGLPDKDDAPWDRERLLAAVLNADPRAGCVARRRKARLCFSSGGTEMELDRASRLARPDAPPAALEQLEAVVVLATRAMAQGAMKRQLFITAASPVSCAFLARAGLGEERVARASLKGGRLVVLSERIWAGKTLATSEAEPQGELARSALVRLFLQGSLHPTQKKEAERRLARRALAARLAKNADFPFFSACLPPPSLETWLSTHLRELGVESGSDLALLSPEDFLPADVPTELAPTLDDRFPLQVDVGDCLYRAEYDLEKRQVLLSIARGARASPPPANYLPRFEGLKVYAEAAGSFHLVRRG